jgi:hypothetical protein
MTSGSDRNHGLSLFRLPTEIRGFIYGFVLARERPVQIDSNFKSSCRPWSLKVHTSLLQTCRRIHNEAIPYLFSANKIVICSPIPQRWGATIQRNILLVRDLTLWVDGCKSSIESSASWAKFIGDICAKRGGNLNRVAILGETGSQMSDRVEILLNSMARELGIMNCEVSNRIISSLSEVWEYQY